MLLADAGFWRVSDIGYQDDLYVRGPRLLHNSQQTTIRIQNWNYILDLEKVKGRCIKREGGISADVSGNSIAYAGKGGFRIGS